MFINICHSTHSCVGIQHWRWSFYHYTSTSSKWGVINIHCYIITSKITCLGNKIISLPSAVHANNVQLQWRALLNAKWSLDNVRIGSDALLYYLQFDIQVGACSPPPINGSVSDYVSLEYYDGFTWSLLQNECLHPKCFLMVII